MKAFIENLAAGTKIYNPFRKTGMAGYERVTFNFAEPRENQDGEITWMINYTDAAGVVRTVITCTEAVDIA